MCSTCSDIFKSFAFKGMKRLVTWKALFISLQVPIKFMLTATIMVNKKGIEHDTKDLIREENLNDCSAQRTLN